MMNKINCRGYRFPPEIIQRAIWLYYRFTLSLRDVEELLAERGIEVTYETIRQWGIQFGPAIARDLLGRPRPHSRWHMDEMFVSIGESSEGHPHYRRPQGAAGRRLRAVDRHTLCFECRRRIGSPLPRCRPLAQWPHRAWRRCGQYPRRHAGSPGLHRLRQRGSRRHRSIEPRQSRRHSLKAHPESFELDGANGRIFVNVPDAGHIAVIDVASGRQAATWPVRDARANFPMAFDNETKQVLVAFRKPAKLMV